MFNIHSIINIRVYIHKFTNISWTFGHSTRLLICCRFSCLKNSICIV